MTSVSMELSQFCTNKISVMSFIHKISDSYMKLRFDTSFLFILSIYRISRQMNFSAFQENSSSILKSNSFHILWHIANGIHFQRIWKRLVDWFSSFDITLLDSMAMSDTVFCREQSDKEPVQRELFLYSYWKILEFSVFQSDTWVLWLFSCSILVFGFFVFVLLS